MKKSTWMRVSALVCALLMVPSGAFANESTPAIAYNDQAAGTVTITVPASEASTYKIRIMKGTEQYTYDAGIYNVFPLQMGDGVYSILILEHVKDNKYKLIKQQQITYTAQSSDEVFLQSVQNIRWDETMDVALKAAELTEHAESEEAKIEAIHQFVVNHVAYDFDKASRVKSGYIPSVEQSYESKSGICYDYAALFAAMLRSIDIPTKLVMGHRSDMEEYHAWNEVYVKEKDEWRIMDTTYDAAFEQGVEVPLFKNAADYQTDRMY